MLWVYIPEEFGALEVVTNYKSNNIYKEAF